MSEEGCTDVSAGEMMKTPDLLGKFDLHVHTTMSDGNVDLHEVVEIAQARGVIIGISDHVSGRKPEQFVSDRARLGRYIEAIESVPVLRAAELCWYDPFAASLTQEDLDRLDY